MYRKRNLSLWDINVVLSVSYQLHTLTIDVLVEEGCKCKVKASQHWSGCYGCLTASPFLYDHKQLHMSVHDFINQKLAMKCNESCNVTDLHCSLVAPDAYPMPRRPQCAHILYYCGNRFSFRIRWTFVLMSFDCILSLAASYKSEKQIKNLFLGDKKTIQQFNT